MGPLVFGRPLVMGVLNVTPDSFSDGGRYLSVDAALVQARRLIGEGADILDVGGESTRPGAEPVPVDEELRRVVPVIEALRDCGVPVSVDTRRATVMRAALEAGAAILNDVSALTADPGSLPVAAASGAPVVLMHALGDPRTMQDDPRYDDVVGEVHDYLAARIETCVSAGIARDRLIVDPGIGFGKTLEHNLALLRSLGRFHALGCPLLLGVSRKSFIGRLAGGVPADARLAGSLAGALAGVLHGVHILRVHDVADTRQAIAVWQAIFQGSTTEGS
ncbi:dihydropteroate synthase [Iodidimonas sp. SYSU 1G8]|uniref:dihydropteroate synthase n=1 Tax=Iodidimonas sp. SYSU 1G8 TaxID=3133967 RepID=UPI0031FEA628